MVTLLLIVGVGAVVMIFLTTVMFGAPYVPSRRRDVVNSFDELYAVGPGDVLVDIGSGDGLILREAAKRGARAIGYEINPVLWLVSRLLSRRYPAVSVRWANYMWTNLPAEVTVVYLFGESQHIGKIDNWLAKQADRLGKPVYVISYGFVLPNRTALREVGAHRLYTVEPLHSPVA